jgi:hypothetical protein
MLGKGSTTELHPGLWRQLLFVLAEALKPLIFPLSEAGGGSSVGSFYLLPRVRFPPRFLGICLSSSPASLWLSLPLPLKQVVG